MIADIVSGEVDWADVLFLIAVILFAVAGVLSITARAIDSALVRFGFTAVALAWLLL